MNRNMRMVSFPRVRLVLGVGLLAGGLLWWLVPRFNDWADRRWPWKPPPLAASGIPADPLRALQDLVALQDPLPECMAHSIEEEGEDGDTVHSHKFIGVKPLGHLRGQTEKILPYLRHPSEPVVHRAASLLCFIQDRPSRRALRWLESHYPCRDWVSVIRGGAGMLRDELMMSRYETDEPPVIADCRKQRRLLGGYDALSAASHDGSTPSPEALALARRISEGDAAAIHEALHATQAMDVARRPDAGHALMRVSTVQGLALVYQALLEGWDAQLLSYVSGWPWREPTWNPEELLTGVGGAALSNVAERTGRPREVVLVETVGRLPESLVKPIAAAVKKQESLTQDILQLARSPEGRAVESTTARAFLEQFVREDDLRRAQSIEKTSRFLTARFQAKDMATLRMFSQFPVSTVFHQALASCYLIALGEKEENALGMLESAPPMPLPDLNAIRSEVKQLLDRSKPGATQQRLQRIFARMSEHCQHEDCSIESPR